jgi:nitrite reductase/ring-hydroxylating ferredoxin subunit
MAVWHKVALASEVTAGTGIERAVAGRVIALYNVLGTFYALDGICPHAGGPLGEGALRGAIVTCPWHGWQFDVTNGRHALHPGVRHACYVTKIEEGAVYVEIP